MSSDLSIPYPVAFLNDLPLNLSIKNLDAILNNHGAKIISVISKGYTLEIWDKAVFQQYLHSIFVENSLSHTGIPKTPEDRVTYIIIRFLLNDQYLKLDYALRTLLLKEIQVIIDEYVLAKANGELKTWEETYGDIGHYTKNFFYYRMDGKYESQKKTLKDYKFSEED